MASPDPRAARAVVYSDGACSGNPGPGGWAWVAPGGRFACGPAPATTNQRMEITAAFEAALASEGPVEVRSDSTYVVNCFRDRWWEGWLARGWLTSARKPVANRDLWEPFVELVRRRGDVRFSWVKGHSGDVWNEVADKLAVAALRRQEASSGERLPDDLSPGGGPAAEGPSPAASTGDAPRDQVGGHALVVVGQQEGDATSVGRHLAELLADRRRAVADLVVVTGLRRGAEQWAAAAARLARVPYVAVLPWPDPDRDWPDGERAAFADLLAGATRQLLLDARSPASPQQSRAALDRRNAWLARSADEAVVVTDGTDERLGRLHRTLVDHVGEGRVSVVHPATAGRP